MSRTKYRFGPFELDGVSGELRKHGVRVRLQEKPLQILLAVLERPGDVVTREELRQRLWPAETLSNFERSFNTALCRLRQSLGDEPDEPKYIQTLARRGYRFIAELESADRPATSPASTAEARGPEAAEDGREPSAKPAWLKAAFRFLMKFPWAAAAIAILLVVLFVVVGMQRRSVPPAAASGGKMLLAVAPFNSIGNDAEQEYLNEGLMDEVITQLARVNPEKLSIVSRSIVMRYKNSQQPVEGIVKETGAQFVLEGSVRRQGPRVRITAQLTRIYDRTSLWAGTFESDVSNVLALQQDVARQIAGALAVELLPSGPAPTRAANSEAMDAYLRGRFQWNRRSPDGVQKAIEYFQQAIQADPSYAPAYAGLADCYVVWSGQLAGVPPREAYTRAKAAVQKALSLDPSLASAHATLAVVLFEYDRNLAAAEQEYRRAVDVDPNYATGYQWYAEFLSAVGRGEEALAAIRRALSLDPYSRSINIAYGETLLGLHRYEDATRQFQKILEMDPTLSRAQEDLARTYLQAGAVARWFPEHQKLMKMNGADENQLAAYEAAFLQGGAPAVIRLRLRRMQEISSPKPYFRMALLYGAIGENDRALDCLEESANSGSFAISTARIVPEFDGLRGNPRFQKLLKRVGIPNPADPLVASSPKP